MTSGSSSRGLASDGRALKSQVRRSGRQFPSLGEIREPTRATCVDFFVTAPHVQRGDGLAAEGNLRKGRVHAKAMGTMLTACGLNATSWAKLWDVPFVNCEAPTCPACVDAVSRVRQGAGSSGVPRGAA